jgi:hypothetical protein
VADADPAAKRGARGGKPARGADWRQAVEGARAEPAARSKPAERERPRAPWHPLPLAEILIVAGALAFVFGLQRGPAAGKAPILLGIAAAAVGTIEFTLREHLGGFRSHTVLLSALPAVVFHTVVVLVVAAVAHVSPGLTLAIVAVDIAIFALLFRILRERFAQARHRAAGAPRARRS